MRDIKNNSKDPPVPAEDFVQELILLATITKVVKGEHGFYAVTVSSFNGQEIYITFSLEKGVLEEDIALTQELLQQLPGTSVVLSNIVSKIVKKRRVWRAYNSRFYRLSDEGQIFANRDELTEFSKEKKQKRGNENEYNSKENLGAS